MSEDIASQGSASPLLRRRRLFVAAGLLLLAAWLAAHYLPYRNLFLDEFKDIPVNHNIIVGGALPWFLQWAGVSCVFLGCCNSRPMRVAAFNVIWVPFLIGAFWWGGTVYRFYGLSGADLFQELVISEIQKSMGAESSLFEVMRTDIFGPLMGPFQLRGPLILRGSDFVFAVLTTTLQIGYFLAGVYFLRIDNGIKSVRNYVKSFGLILPCFLPVFVHMSIKITELIKAAEQAH